MHQHPKQYLKDGLVVDNSWQLVAADADTLTAGDILISVTYWQANQQQLADHSGNVGVWVDGHEEVEEFAGSIATVPVIAINFPKFVDGRGFSMARLLRERYGYIGEIRAIGQFIRDQLFMMQRCGFNAFQFDSEIDLAAASKSLSDFSDSYQVAADQPEPLFKRQR
jgi:uncharacterized protein (DUF934 family)